MSTRAIQLFQPLPLQMVDLKENHSLGRLWLPFTYMRQWCCIAGDRWMIKIGECCLPKRVIETKLLNRLSALGFRSTETICWNLCIDSVHPRIDKHGRQHTTASLVSGGSRILKRGFQCAIECARSMPTRGGWGHAPQENFLISDLLKSFLVPIWGEIACKSWTTYCQIQSLCLKRQNLKTWLRFTLQRLQSSREAREKRQFQLATVLVQSLLCGAERYKYIYFSVACVYLQCGP